MYNNPSGWTGGEDTISPRPVRPNEAEYGTPRTSHYGVMFKVGIGGTQPRQLPVNPERALPPGDIIVSGRAGLVREDYPRYFAYKWRDFIGTFAARIAQTRTVVPTQFRYKGQMPTDQQPRINKPKPWLGSSRASGLP